MVPILIVLYVIVALLLILIVLLQASKAAGMGLFGGGSSESVLGSGGADTLTKITAGFAIAFVLIAFSITYILSRQTTVLDKEFQRIKKSEIERQQQQQQQGQDQMSTPAVLPQVISTNEEGEK